MSKMEQYVVRIATTSPYKHSLFLLRILKFSC